MAVAAALGACLSPVVGLLLDRFGARPVMITGIILFAVTTAMQSLMSAAPLVIYSLIYITVIPPDVTGRGLLVARQMRLHHLKEGPRNGCD